MINRTLLAAIAVTAALAPSLPYAQDAPGMLVCERDVQEIQGYLDANRAQLSEQAMRDAQRRLEIAQTECNSSPQSGSNTVAQLRRDLGMEIDAQPQTAQPPQEGRSPGGYQ